MPQTPRPSAGERLMMARSDLRKLPDDALPPGFRWHWYQPGDEAAWLAIHRQADPWLEYSPEVFDREFGAGADRLPQRQLYLRSPAGSLVGTATAWYDRDFGGSPAGRVHWVALIPPCQGQGLGKALLGHTLRQMVALGEHRAYLVTSAARLPALGLYLHSGFRPHVEGDTDRRAWQRLSRQLPALRQMNSCREKE